MRMVIQMNDYNEQMVQYSEAIVVLVEAITADNAVVMYRLIEHMTTKLALAVDQVITFTEKQS